MISLDDFNRVPTTDFPPVAQQPVVYEGILITEASRSLSDRTRSVGLLWTNG